MTPPEWYARFMTRVAGRSRLIAVIALLSQVAAGAHIPMLHASTAGHVETALEHCASGAHQGTTLRHDQLSHQGHGNSCSCGLCQCPCAQAPALVSVLLRASAAVHLPVMNSYRVPDVPHPASVFFRPPI